jgi:hypothetical protein
MADWNYANGAYSQVNKAKYRVVAKKRRFLGGLATMEDAHAYADEQQDSGAWPPIDLIDHDARYWVFYTLKEAP